MRKHLITALFAILASCLGPACFADVTLVPLASGLASPVDITHAGDGSRRIFIVEQGGRIRIVQNGLLLPTPFLDLTAAPSIISGGGERGLLGLAFHPQYASNGQFFVYLTSNVNAGAGIATGDILIARFQRSAANPNLADPASRVNILTIPHPGQSNHNGGSLRFGPDGYLYAGVGDGGGGGDPNGWGQNRNVLLGKILRIDINSGSPYSVPPTNPFVGVANTRPEIWAYGVRNPWRFSFDRLTGDFYIGDVGQGDWEEIDFQAAGSSGGANYGWNVCEGKHRYPPQFPAADCVPPANYVAPLLEYSHAVGIAVTGGYVYRGASSPDIAGKYVFGDYGDAKLFVANGPGSFTQLPGLSPQVSTFGEGETGELYLANISTGVISSFSSSTDTTPDPVIFPALSGVPLNTTQVSNLVRVTGLGATASISITGGDYTQSLSNSCSGSYTNATGTITTNTYICVRHTSAPTASTTRTTILTVGTATFTFASTTLPAPAVFNVTPSMVGNGFISPDTPQQVQQGLSAHFTVTPMPGHTAAVTGTCGGTLNGTNFDTLPVSADCTVIATFTPNTYAVTPTAGPNGSIAPATVQSVAHGSTTMFTVTANAGYTASVGGTCGGTLAGTQFTTASITAACTVDAIFSLNSYAVTASAGANGSISPSGAQSVSHGATATFTVTPNAGYTASVGGSCGGALVGTTYTTNPIIAACTVTASFTPIPPMPPGAPIIDSAGGGDGLAVVAVSAPASDGGSPITRYNVDCGGFTAIGLQRLIIVTGLTNGVLYSCRVTATNIAGTGPASATVDVTPTNVAPVGLWAAQSRKTHGAAGDFDLPITLLPPISLPPRSVEPRMIGDGHRIVFQFSAPISSVGSATARDSASVFFPGVNVDIFGHEVVVRLTGIDDRQVVVVSLSDVQAANGSTLSTVAGTVDFLVGDAAVSNPYAGHGINASDISAVKARAGQTLDLSNFRFDVNTSGAIDAADLSMVKARSGIAMP